MLTPERRNTGDQLAGSASLGPATPPLLAPSYSKRVGNREYFVGPSYEQLLTLDPRWALSEGDLHFSERNQVFLTMRKVAKRLTEIGVKYSVVGGLALFQHGFRRFTEDVDILVTKSDLKLIHEKLDGLGYLPPFSNSKHLRDVDTNVKIEFLVSGGFPGDGKAKPVSFPDPRDVSVEFNGVSYIKLNKLVDLKLASGMTNRERLKDLSDVLELIKVLRLPEEFADELDPFVRNAFKDLWTDSRKRYVMTWRNKWLSAQATSIGEMISSLREAAKQLEQMQADGVTLDPKGGTSDDYALLVTTDPKIAEKYGLLDEMEYWEGDDRKETDEPPNQQDE